MLAALRDFAQREEHSESDSCFVVLMSHGNASGIGGVFYSSENGDEEDLFQVDEIFNCLNTPNCTRLRDKPKIILIQACRGGELQNTILEKNKLLLFFEKKKTLLFKMLSYLIGQSLINFKQHSLANAALML